MILYRVVLIKLTNHKQFSSNHNLFVIQIILTFKTKVLFLKVKIKHSKLKHFHATF